MTESDKAVMQNAYGHLRLLRKNVPYTMWTGIDEALAQLSAAIAQPEQKANFCSRCGKLVSAIHDIHTCTPPVGHTN